MPPWQLLQARAKLCHDEVLQLYKTWPLWRRACRDGQRTWGDDGGQQITHDNIASLF